MIRMTRDPIYSLRLPIRISRIQWLPDIEDTKIRHQLRNLTTVRESHQNLRHLEVATVRSRTAYSSEEALGYVPPS
jgi:hypothetical protein